MSVEEACQLHERAMALREDGQLAEAATLAQQALWYFEREQVPTILRLAQIRQMAHDGCELEVVLSLGRAGFPLWQGEP